MIFPSRRMRGTNISLLLFLVLWEKGVGEVPSDPPTCCGNLTSRKRYSQVSFVNNLIVQFAGIACPIRKKPTSRAPVPGEGALWAPLHTSCHRLLHILARLRPKWEAKWWWACSIFVTLSIALVLASWRIVFYMIPDRFLFRPVFLT